MADNQLDILIRIITQELGPQKANEVVKKFTEETKKATEETKKATVATQENTTATDRAFTSKKQLKDAVRGLSMEFPILGRLASLALNPISLIVAGIAGAFTIWKRRVDELTISLAGFQMPDVTTDQIARIDAGATALGKFAVEMAKLKDSSKQVKDDLAAVLKQIKFLEDLRKASGQETGTTAAEDEALAKEMAAAALEAKAAGKIAAAGTPGSSEAEAELGGKYKAAAEEAAKAQATARQRLGDIAEMQDSPWWRKPYDDARFRMRYGNETTYDEARAMEQGNIGSAQTAIDQYRSFREGSVARGIKRGMITSADADVAEAARLRGEASDVRSGGIVSLVQGFTQGGGFAGTTRDDPTTAGARQTEFREVIASIARSKADMSELMAILKRVFADGIVSPKELAEVKAALQNQTANQRRN